MNMVILCQDFTTKQDSSHLSSTTNFLFIIIIIIIIFAIYFQEEIRLYTSPPCLLYFPPTQRHLRPKLIDL